MTGVPEIDTLCRLWSFCRCRTSVVFVIIMKHFLK